MLDWREAAVPDRDAEANCTGPREAHSAMIACIHLTPAELVAAQAAAAGPARRTAVLWVTRFRAGVDLLVLAQSAASPSFLPEFHQVWWRRPYRWARRWHGVETLAHEVRAHWRRGSQPFFVPATSRFPAWEPIWKGCRASLDDHIDFVLPSSDALVDAAHDFLGQWIDQFRELVPAASGTDQPIADDALIEALLAMPLGLSAMQDAALADRVQRRLDGMLNGRAERAPGLRGVFPNLLEFMLPTGMPDDACRTWHAILDKRLQWIADAIDPRHYPPIQGLASPDEWEREFVAASPAGHPRGARLVGAHRIERLVALGCALQQAFPVLGRDPFEHVPFP